MIPHIALSDPNGDLIRHLIDSLLRTLSLVGLNRSEQREVFEALLLKLDDGETENGGDHEGISAVRTRLYNVADTDPDDPREALEYEFESQEFSKSLSRLGKRLASFYDSDDRSLPKALALCIEVVPLVTVAQKWLIQNASEKGILTVPNKASWIKSATDDELDREDEVLFLDESDLTRDFQLNFMVRLSNALLRSGRFEELKAFYEILIEADLPFDSEALSELNNNHAAIAEFDRLQATLRAMVSGSELPQSAFLGKFTEEGGHIVQPHMVEEWVRLLAKQGVLRVQKKANRWTIAIL
jgi:hypothetical protein